MDSYFWYTAALVLCSKEQNQDKWLQLEWQQKAWMLRNKDTSFLVKEQTNIVKIQGTSFFHVKSLQDHYILSHFPRNCPQSLEGCYMEQVLTNI